MNAEQETTKEGASETDDKEADSSGETVDGEVVDVELVLVTPKGDPVAAPRDSGDGQNEYTLIELKSPKAEVFDIKEKTNDKGGKSTEYVLSRALSRSIPQILNYRESLENKAPEDEDFQKIGIEKGKIKKCIILIGTRKKTDTLWENHFLNLQRSFSNSLEICTYTDLINKLDTTIKNLKENL